MNDISPKTFRALKQLALICPKLRHAQYIVNTNHDESRETAYEALFDAWENGMTAQDWDYVYDFCHRQIDPK